MTTIAALALACAVAVSAVASIGEGPRLSRSIVESAKPYAPNEAIVRFGPGTSSGERREARREAGVAYEGSFGLPRAQVVEVEGSVKAAVRRLERQPGVAYAQPNYRYEALAVEPPDDTFFGELWGLSDPALPNPGVSALEAWENNRGSGQVIAVLDTGVDLTHPDLAGNLWTNPSPDPGLHGHDFVDNDGNPDDYDFHGTHVAGTAAAIADNNLGIAGVAPEAEIMAVRVLDGDGSGFTSDIAAGIVYAAERGADVINLSLGGPAGGDEATEDAIELAGTEGTVVVAAAGNEGVNNDKEPHSPCVLPQSNLICVAALNQSGSLAGFSNFGVKTVDLAAPGTSILSAKTDYGAPVFSDGFESGLGLWTTQAFDGGKPWGLSGLAANGSEKSATDSPAGDYGQQEPSSFEPAISELFTTAAVDLTGERGCRLHFETMYEIETFFDAFVAGAMSEVPDFDGREFDGASPGYPSSLLREEASVSDLDGRNDVHPIFGILSDESVEFDGAYVDDVRLFCRDETYVDAISTVAEYDQAGAGNYVRFQGTSMATPHVTGVVALVRAAAPSLNAQETVDAVLEGASAIPKITTGKRTATEGIADACKAIAVATGANVEATCPASSEPTPQPEPPSTPVQPDGESPNPFPPTEPQPDRTRPGTFFKKHPPKVLWTRDEAARAVFRFSSNESDVVFLCRLDRGTFVACRRRTARRFELGRHVVRVKARDAAGNVDPTPAVFRFVVKQRE